MVAVLAHGLAVIGRDIFHKEVDAGQVAVYALYHDAPEILTGDLPTPVKYYNPEIEKVYKEIEGVSAKKLLALLPPELRPSYQPLLEEECDPYIHALVKAADKMSAYIKCVEELKAGNSEFQAAAVQTLGKLKESSLPEVEYFMEHFIEGFSLTLDELQGKEFKL